PFSKSATINRGSTVGAWTRYDMPSNRIPLEKIMNQHMKRVALLLISISCFSAQLPARAEVADSEVKNILQDRIDRAKRGVGIFVGLVEEKGRAQNHLRQSNRGQ